VKEAQRLAKLSSDDFEKEVAQARETGVSPLAALNAQDRARVRRDPSLRRVRRVKAPRALRRSRTSRLSTSSGWPLPGDWTDGDRAIMGVLLNTVDPADASHLLDWYTKSGLSKVRICVSRDFLIRSSFDWRKEAAARLHRDGDSSMLFDTNGYDDIARLVEASSRSSTSKDLRTTTGASWR
jgi:hypothetical protein